MAENSEEDVEKNEKLRNGKKTYKKGNLKR